MDKWTIAALSISDISYPDYTTFASSVAIAAIAIKSVTKNSVGRQVSGFSCFQIA